MSLTAMPGKVLVLRAEDAPQAGTPGRGPHQRTARRASAWRRVLSPRPGPAGCRSRCSTPGCAAPTCTCCKRIR